MLLFVLSSNFLSISQLFLFVNNFFIFLLNFLKFVAAVFSGELYNIKPSNKCQQLFSTFFKKYIRVILLCFSHQLTPNPEGSSSLPPRSLRHKYFKLKSYNSSINFLFSILLAIGKNNLIVSFARLFHSAFSINSIVRIL